MRGKDCAAGRKTLRKPALIVAVVSLVLTSLFASSAWRTGRYRTLYRFTDGTDGAYSAGSLIFDANGNLYGTTAGGGAYSAGTVFKLMPQRDRLWKETVLHSFGGSGDGFYPGASLIFDSYGNLYGTTGRGGAYDKGTVFELMPQLHGVWKLKLLHSFNGSDGWAPVCTLTMDSVGNLYGTTNEGGASSGGTVFEVKPNSDGSWTETVLHSFGGSQDGSYPFAGVVLDPDGNLYGTTSSGGPNSSGIAFELMPQTDGTWKENMIHAFANNGTDGYYPIGGLVFDAAGNLFGTTAGGGGGRVCGQFGCGLVFKLAPQRAGVWDESILHVFSGGDGSRPSAGLILDSAGSLYSTTQNDGLYGYGTLFRLSPDREGGWKAAVLHSFRDHPGALPVSGLVLDGQNRLYGTTQGDHQTTFGSVFVMHSH